MKKKYVYILLHYVNVYFTACKQNLYIHIVIYYIFILIYNVMENYTHKIRSFAYT